MTSDAQPSIDAIELIDLGDLERFRVELTLLARIRLGRSLRGKADPNDLVQETFLIALTNLSQFRGENDRQLLAWLRAILNSRVKQLVERFLAAAARDVRRERRLATDSADSSRFNPETHLAADQSTPSRAAQRHEQAELVAAALAKLPKDHCEVLLLRNIEGLTFPQVAEKMNRTVGSVTMLWTRAVREFRTNYPEGI